MFKTTLARIKTSPLGQKANPQQFKLILVMFLVILLSTLMGYEAGYEAGTGSSTLDLLYRPASAALPGPQVTTMSIVIDVLDAQPRRLYQDGYNCVDFAWDAMRTLAWKGQPAAILRMGFEGGEGHAVLLVPTTDEGWQFIEPQTHAVIHPKLGGTYNGLEIVNMTVLTTTWAPLNEFEAAPSYGVRGWPNDLENK